MSALSFVVSLLTSIAIALSGLGSAISPVGSSTFEAVDTRVVGEEGLENIHARHWEKYEVVEPDVIRITFWGGVCEGYRVKVTETPISVKLELQEGTYPDPDSSDACILIAVQKEMDIQLDKPLGNRLVIQ